MAQCGVPTRLRADLVDLPGLFAVTSRSSAAEASPPCQVSPLLSHTSRHTLSLHKAGMSTLSLQAISGGSSLVCAMCLRCGSVER